MPIAILSNRSTTALALIAALGLVSVAVVLLWDAHTKRIFTSTEPPPEDGKLRDGDIWLRHEK